MIGLKPNRERIQNLTRDAIRELLQRPDLCAKLRANNCDNRHKKLNSEVEKLRNWVGNLVHSVPYTPYHIVRAILGVFHLVWNIAWIYRLKFIAEILENQPNTRISMFDRLTMKQSEADDQVLFIRKGNSLFDWTCVCLLLLAAVILLNVFSKSKTCRDWITNQENKWRPCKCRTRKKWWKRNKIRKDRIAKRRYKTGLSHF